MTLSQASSIDRPTAPDARGVSGRPWIGVRPRVLLWLAALVAALALDGAVASFVQPYARTVKHATLSHDVKEFGHVGSVLFVGLFLWLLHPARWRAAGLLCATAVVSGVACAVARLVVWRARPVLAIEPYHFALFRARPGDLLHMHNLAFPSGHACLAFAGAACLAYLLPKGRWAFYAVAVAVAAQRVAELAHYLSDVVAGAAIGVLSFHLTLMLCRRFAPRLGGGGGGGARV